MALWIVARGTDFPFHCHAAASGVVCNVASWLAKLRAELGTALERAALRTLRLDDRSLVGLWLLLAGRY